MNERIKELAEQSYEYAVVTTIDPFTQEVVTDYIDGTKPIFNKEKFAELIVKECLKVVDTRYNGLSDKDSIRLFKMIEDHMGMKIDMRYTEAEHKYFADLAEKYEQD